MIPATISFVFFIALTVRLTKIRVTFKISKIKVNESMLFRISLLIINIGNCYIHYKFSCRNNVLILSLIL